MLQVGDAVPDFELPVVYADGRKEKVQMKSLLGKGPIVLAFYPMAFTGLCTTEMCQMRDQQAFFDHLEAKTFGFSTDTPPTNAAFAKAHNLQHGLMSDANFEVVDKIWQSATIGGIHHRAKRGWLVVSPQGRVAAQWMSDDPAVWSGLEPIQKALAPFHTHAHAHPQQRQH